MFNSSKWICMEKFETHHEMNVDGNVMRNSTFSTLLVDITKDAGDEIH